MKLSSLFLRCVIVFMTVQQNQIPVFLMRICYFYSLIIFLHWRLQGLMLSIPLQTFLKRSQPLM